MDLEPIKARVNEATKGPWEVEDGIVFSGLTEVVCLMAWNGTEEQVAADAAFIAHARRDVPALIAEVERLTELVRRQPIKLEGGFI